MKERIDIDAHAKSDDILDIWQASYGTLVPMGEVLRKALSERWIRVYSLPDGKRYPTSSDEEKVLLDRHNQFASDLLGDSEVCVCFQCKLLEVDGIPDVTSCIDDSLKLKIVPQMTFVEFQKQHCFYAGYTHWSMQKFGDLVLRVAHDKLAYVCFLNPSRRTIYAPYDGGADTIHHSRSEALAFSAKYRDSVSPLDSGL